MAPRRASVREGGRVIQTPRSDSSGACHLSRNGSTGYESRAACEHAYKQTTDKQAMGWMRRGRTRKRTRTRDDKKRTTGRTKGKKLTYSFSSCVLLLVRPSVRPPVRSPSEVLVLKLLLWVVCSDLIVLPHCFGCNANEVTASRAQARTRAGLIG